MTTATIEASADEAMFRSAQEALTFALHYSHNQSPGKPMTGRKDGHQTAARESAGAGGFDSRSLAEIVVKDGVRIPDCGASRLASALGVESGLTAGKDRHQQLLTRRLWVVCFSAPNFGGNRP